MICLSCTGKTVKNNLDVVRENIQFIDIIELRADFLVPEEYASLKTFPSEAGLPCILTFRKPEDGGVDTGLGIKERCRILSAALTGGWAYLDIEENAEAACEQQLVRDAESAGIRIIKSFHDFNGVPDNLAQRMFNNSCGDRYIPKAAVMPRNSSDLMKIVGVFNELSELKSKSAGYSCTNGPLLTDFILVGMGPVGFPSRVMAGAWGGMLTFCSAGPAKAAPGHIKPRELAEVYNFRRLSGKTRLFGIIGNPAMHSKSPQLHNAAFKTLNIDAVYLPFETVDPGVIIENAEALKLDGLSVTVPYKKTVIPMASSVDISVTEIGACNTLVRKKEWRGYNTDWKGFLAPLEDEKLDGCTAIVIGAGGAARSVVYALRSAGMEVVIANRTVSRADELASEFGCSAVSIDDAVRLSRTGGKYKLAVQTSSVGMSPDINGNPVPGFDFSNVEIAYDIIYTPEQTSFLANAALAGCRTLNGYPMLKAQASEQFFLFTGKVMNETMA